MYSEEIKSVSETAKKKIDFYKSGRAKYFVAAMLAGMFIGFGVVLIYTVGGEFSAAGSPFTKLVMGLLFGTALSFVVMAGAELFTGNAMVMSVGMLKKTVSIKHGATILIASFIGNMIGSVILSLLMDAGGLFSQNAIDFILTTSSAKMNAPFLKLFIAGILCNILVCLPIWCSYRMKSESGKLIMIFCGIVMFVSPGFEHCIASMTLLSSALFMAHDATITIGGFFYSVLACGLGNLVGGGLVVGGGYWFMSREKQKKLNAK